MRFFFGFLFVTLLVAETKISSDFLTLDTENEDAVFEGNVKVATNIGEQLLMNCDFAKYSKDGSIRCSGKKIVCQTSQDIVKKLKNFTFRMLNGTMYYTKDNVLVNGNFLLVQNDFRLKSNKAKIILKDNKMVAVKFDNIVMIVLKDVIAKSDEAYYTFSDKNFVMFGNVTIVKNNDLLRGKVFKINLNNNTYKLFDGISGVMRKK